MNYPITYLYVLSFVCSIIVPSGELFAQTAVSSAVGQVTVQVKAQADRRFGITLTRQESYVGQAASVSDGTITVDNVVPDVTTEAHYLLVTSGNLLGSWFEVTASTGSTVTVGDKLANLGFNQGDRFKLIPFWTLDTLFPEGGDIPQSPDAFSPIAFVLLNDPMQIGINLPSDKTCFYHDGTQGPAGWYENGNLGAGLIGSTTYVEPGSYIAVRNATNSPISVTNLGSVPDQTINTRVLSRSAGRQDNKISNPFPVDISLADSKLFEDGAIGGSPDAFSPGDLLLIFEGAPTGYNPTSSKTVFYHDGSQGPAGWYENGNLGAGLINDYVIPAGAALIVRRSTGNDEIISWSPDLPY